MFDTRKTLHNGGILDVIKILSTNSESGKLEISAGKTDGAFFFRKGQLVDARVGDLTGFRAVNALAAMRDVRFSFDPSIYPPSVSSITPNERVVLKQFFGIETIDSSRYEDEVTMETQRLPIPVLPEPVIPEPVQDIPTPKSLYRVGMIFAILFILIAIGAVALRNKYRERERALPPAVATTQPAVSQPPVSQPTVSQPAVSQPAVSQPTVSQPAVSQPAVSQPPVSQPIVEQPAVAQPVVAQDLTGKWNVVNNIQKTSYRSFQNMNIGFELTINQSGKSFTGEGRKVSENGRSLPASGRTPIEVKGSIDGDRVEATFFENGTLRKTNGRFVWRIDQASGGLNGTFVTTAAGSSGKSAARREL
ncbi:MAG TPA: DUF4388 domain-containing protein [Pyrinomonadaceae bacterium]|nr:DUF4388 domain-containing protein [Pyrinomonadaceae bacterium]